MDKGPHFIKLTPGGVPPIIHLSQYEGGDGTEIKYAANQSLQFILLQSDDQYYEFSPGKTDSESDNLLPARLLYSRPDGVDGRLNLSLHPQNYIVVDSGGTRRFSEPNFLYLQNLPSVLTECAGDVVCEIQIISKSNEKNLVQKSENFILRIEKYPDANIMPFYSIYSRKYSGAEVADGSAGSYYGGDPIDENAITWQEVLKAANNGSLFDVLEVGQEIRAVQLTTGEYMGLRCIHIVDYKDAYFEPFHLFSAPKNWTYNPSGGQDSGRYAALQYLLADYDYPYDDAWIKNLPYAVRKLVYTGKPYSRVYENGYYIFGESSNGQTFIGTESYNMPGGVVGQRQIPQFDYYKTVEGRIKTTPDGVARPWQLGFFTADGWACVSADGNYEPRDKDEYPAYVNPILRLIGEDHADPATAMYDIKSWQDVKDAAAKGKLKNSTLELGQLMPELPTLGVLRCVHIEDHWAAFVGVKGSCKGIDITNTLQGNFNINLSDEEKSYFTILSSNAGGYINRAQMITNKNTNLSNENAGGYNTILANTVFDYYKLKDYTSIAGSWASYDTTWAAWYTSNSTQAERTSNASNYTRSIAGVLAVGEIS